MTLISNTNYGILCKSKESEFKTRLEYLDWYEKTRSKFDLFVKQPLELWMFIPCDEKGNVLHFPEFESWKGTDDEHNEAMVKYYEAKDRVLFEGFIVSKNNGNIIVTNGKISILFSIRNFIKHIDSNVRIESIDDLTKYNLTLTESAIKQLHYETNINDRFCFKTIC